MTALATCDHHESRWGRCTACGMTWGEQATTVERSPMGEERERPVPCQLCHRRYTANFSAICTPCRKRDWSPLAAALDALAAISEPKGTR